MKDWLKKQGIDGYGDLANLIGIFLFFGFCLFALGVMSSCTSPDQYIEHLMEENDSLKVKLGQRDNLIRHYEEFKDIATYIYISEVDSTGDGFDSSDDGCKFWRQSQTIDSLTNEIN